MEEENKKNTRRRGDVQVVGDPLEEMKKLKGELEKALVNIHNSLAAELGNRRRDSKDEEKCSLKDVVCYRYREKGHVKRRYPKQAEVQGQGNISLRLDKQ